MSADRAVMACPACGAPVAQGDAFCQACGLPLAGAPASAAPAASCPSCGAPVGPGDAFCEACGAALGVAPAAAAPQGANAFCQVCGSPLTPGLRFCVSCGEPVPGAQGAPVGGPPVPAAQPPHSPAVTPNGTVVVSTDEHSQVVPAAGAQVPGAGGQRAAPIDGELPIEPMNHLVVLTRAEARMGCTKAIEVEGQTLNVRIPAGVNVTTKLDVTDNRVWDAHEGVYRPLRLSFYLID